MPTENRNPRHNLNSHARSANEAIEFAEGIDYIHNPPAPGDRIDGPYVYDVYGQQKPPDASPPGDFQGWNYLFQGLALDPTKPLCEDRGRNCSPTLARWIDQEPSAAYVDGLNVYTAESDNPINAINPLGDAGPENGHGSIPLERGRNSNVLTKPMPAEYVDAIVDRDNNFTADGISSQTVTTQDSEAPLAA